MLSETAAVALVLSVGAYLALGLVFAVPFVARGIGRIDPAARGGSRGFRLLVLPGAVAFWPLLAWRWAKETPPPEQADAHRRSARRSAGQSGEAP